MAACRGRIRLVKRMKRHLVVLCCLLCLFMTPSAFAGSTKFDLDLGVNYVIKQSQSMPDISQANQKLGLRVSPLFVSGKFAMKLDAFFFVDVGFAPPRFGFWPDNWLPPQREDGESDFSYGMRVASHYSGVINYMTWGSRSDDFYFRWGKLYGETMGDGVFINSYRDLTVDGHTSRPGVMVKLDGKAVNAPWFGFELLADDFFHPSLLAARAFARPWTGSGIGIVKDSQVGLTYIVDPYGYSVENEDGGTDSVPSIFAVAADIRSPLYQQEWFGASLFCDIILQFPSQKILGMSHALRFGVEGHASKWVLFNGSLTVPTANGYIPSYFESGFTTRTIVELESLKLQAGQLHFDGRIGAQSQDATLYAGLLFQADYLWQDIWSNRQFGLRLRMDRKLYGFNGVTLTYDKHYPGSSNNEGAEAFGNGLFTLRNASMGLEATVKISLVNLDLGLAVSFDDTGKSSDFKIEIGAGIPLV